ncbi:cytochrome P450 [Spirillospora albida]|uniref:cytochrome P450 n=1 Tax=Spirillospora albida TaxID=58123 RepID=UPI00068CD27A|nr:cytochrome P450 [Spirillospora albida]
MTLDSTSPAPTCPRFPFPATSADPLALPGAFEGLDPVTHVVLPGGEQAWLITGYAETVRALRETDVFERAAADGIAPYPMTAGTVLAMDGEGHRALRGLVGNAFAPAAIRRQRPEVERLTGAILDDLMSRSGPVEIQDELAMPLTLGVIGNLLGAPEEDLPRFAAWGDLFLSTGPDRDEENRRAITEMAAYMGAHMQRLLSDPSSSSGLIGEIGALAVERNVPMEQAVVFAAGLVIAGWETTAAAICSFLYRLLTSTGEDGTTRYRELCDRPDRIAGAVEELMRTVPNSSWTTAQPRRATRDVELGGVPVRAGDLVIPAIDAADRDPARFPEPGRVDFERSPNPHLGFGSGPHVCLGAPLARLELNVVLEQLTARAPGLRLHRRPEEVPWNTATTVRRPSELLLDLR